MFTIQDGTKISTVQTLFNTTFPFLKLEFFKHPHKVYGYNTKKELLRLPRKPDEQLIGEVGKVIRITEDSTVASLEQLFIEYFGLLLQVFHKSGKLWLETTITDDWTLKKQNEEGLELSKYTAL